MSLNFCKQKNKLFIDFISEFLKFIDFYLISNNKNITFCAIRNIIVLIRDQRFVLLLLNNFLFIYFLYKLHQPNIFSSKIEEKVINNFVMIK